MLSEEGAMRLLEAMLKDSATEFEGGVSLYIQANKMMDKAKKNLKAALKECATASKLKQDAMSTIRAEYKFLSGREPVKPPIDVEYVVPHLIMGVVGSMTDKELDELLNKEESDEKN